MGGLYEVDKTSSGTVTKTTVYYPLAGAMRINGTLYYMLKDHLGSASVLTDASGNVLGENRYYAVSTSSTQRFGETRWSTGTILTDKLFTGQRAMRRPEPVEGTDLGIYHYQSRFYSPKLGRFLSADTIVPNPANPQDYNRYAYVRNNPVRYIDPSGHCIEANGNVNMSGYPYGTSGLCPARTPSTGESDGNNGGNTRGGNEDRNNADNNSGLNCPTNHPNCGFGLENCGNSNVVDCPAEQAQSPVLPQTVTAHPIDVNPILDVPIYDYDTGSLIGYRHVRYGVYDFSVSAAGYVIPTDPLTWTQFLRDQTRPILKGFIANAESVGVKLTCPPPCGLILTIAATSDSINSAIILDTHPYTVDLYFAESPYLIETPFVPLVSP